MANADRPNGFLIYDPDGRCWKARRYSVAAANSRAISKGDMCSFLTGGTVTRSAAGSDGTNGVTLVGVCVATSYLDTQGNEIKGTLLPTSKAGYAYIVDAMDARFVVQSDDDSTASQESDLGGNADLVDGTPVALSTYEGHSIQELDGSALPTGTGTAQLRAEERFPVESNAFGSSTTDNLHGRYVVRIHEHFRAPAALTAGI